MGTSAEAGDGLGPSEGSVIPARLALLFLLMVLAWWLGAETARMGEGDPLCRLNTNDDDDPSSP